MASRHLDVSYLSIVLATAAQLASGTQTNISALLAPEMVEDCAAKCASFHAGASANDTLVCQYARSGVGSLVEKLSNGLSCFPPYGCQQDWTVCYQRTKPPEPEAHPCDEIASLVAGGNGGNHPPPGGWMPTSQGWMKAQGYPECGWGSTYSHVEPGGSWTLEDFGRVSLSDITYDDRSCCVAATAYDGHPLEDGGAAIRFGVQSGRCIIDREKMMHGNLDSSGGRSLKNTQTCGNSGVEADAHLFWRQTAGSADASDLKSGGRCVPRGNFTRVAPSDFWANRNPDAKKTLPVGRLPFLGYGAELPNHKCDDTCRRAARYNTVNDAEECCEACRTLKWFEHPSIDGLAMGGGREANPCVAWQIIDGKCHILRKAYFEEINAPTVADAIGNAGYWGSCDPDSTDPSTDCNYFSFMYYREAELDYVRNDTSVPYRKIDVVEIPDDGGPLSPLNFSAVVMPLSNRSRRPGLVTGNASAGSYVYSCNASSGVCVASGATPSADSLGGTNVGIIQVFSEDAVDELLSDATITVFNEEADVAPLCTSSATIAGDAVAFCTAEQLAPAAAVSRRSRRRLSGGSAGTIRLVLSYGSHGSGHDTIDFLPTDSVSGVVRPGPGLSSPQPQVPQTGHASVVSIAFTASGDVSDYPRSTRDVILAALATAAGFDETPPGADLNVTAASVRITAVLPATSAGQAATAQATLSAAAGSASALTAILQNAGLSGVTVESAPLIATGTMAPPPPPRNDPPVAAIAIGSVVALVLVAISLAALVRKTRTRQPHKQAAVEAHTKI